MTEPCRLLLRRLLALIVSGVAAAAAAATDPPARGHLVLIGGGSKPHSVMEKFVELAGGPAAPIVVFPTASAEPDTGEYYRRLFTEEHGCTDVTPLAVVDRADAERDEIVALVDGAKGVFFAGGDQRRIVTALRDTPVGAAVRRAFERGAVIGGTSAGTACMSPLMITGDGDFGSIIGKNVELWAGLDLLADTIVDQHFVARQRLNRLLSAVMEHPELLGVGIDEATAIWVRPDRTLQVLGESSVVVLDARAAAVRRQPRPGSDQPLLAAAGVTLHVLVPGDIFDLNRRSLIGAPGEGRQKATAELLSSPATAP